MNDIGISIVGMAMIIALGTFSLGIAQHIPKVKRCVLAAAMAVAASLIQYNLALIPNAPTHGAVGMFSVQSMWISLIIVASFVIELAQRHRWQVRLTSATALSSIVFVITALLIGQNAFPYDGNAWESVKALARALCWQLQ